MPFRGISIDDEGSIIYDGEKFIVNNLSKVPDDFNPGNKPVVGLPKTHPSHPQNRKPSPAPKYVPPPVIYTAFDNKRAEEHQEPVQEASGSHESEEEEKRRETGSNKPSLSGFPQDMEWQPDISALGLVNFVDVPGNSIDPADMEFYLAARHNPVVHEVQIAIQCEGIPPAFQGDSERYLRLCGEYGIDEENDAEARACLDYWTQKLLGHGIKELSSRLAQNSNDLLNDAWEEALDKSGTADANDADAAESFESYQTLVEDTFNVRFTRADGADEWNLANIRTAHVGLEMTARVFGNRLRDMGLAVDDAKAFQLVFGAITLNRSTTASDNAIAQVIGHTITIFWKQEQENGRNYNLLPYLLLHELGHIFNAAAGMGDKDGSSSINQTIGHPQSRVGMGAPNPAVLTGELFIASHSDLSSDLRSLYEDLGAPAGHELFTEADLNEWQIQSLQQSEDESPNEVTADAFLNWIVHQTSDRAEGFTDAPEGCAWQEFMGRNMDKWLRYAIVHQTSDDGAEGFTNAPEGCAWQEFMDANMDKWLRNAIVYNARDNENALTFFAEQDMLPQVVGIGTIPFLAGTNVRETPSTSGRKVTTLEKGKNFPIFGRIEVEEDLHRDWIAVMAQGDVYWVYAGGVELPEGVNLKDLPVFESKEDASFKFDPNSPFEETPWFPQLVRHLR